MSNPLSRLADFPHDPLGFVRWAFDWGHGDLRGEEGPEDWQAELLTKLGDELKRQAREGGAIRFAVKSGHGVGKSCLMSWVIWFFMSTRPDIQVIATANTDTQLKTKLWRELAKWRRRAINSHMFEWTATSLKSVESPEDWYASAISWNETNPEAMAGAHDKTVVYLFDEASWIPKVIWDTAEGALTDGGGVFLAFGNPTRNTGPFFDCFNKKAKYWNPVTVNSETVRRVDKTLLAQWREMEGPDSDYYRIRALGQFPRFATSQFIPSYLVWEAQDRTVDVEVYKMAPKVLGVDVARFGDDRTVITLRRGPKVWPQQVLLKHDVIEVGKAVAQVINSWKPDTVFIDEVGLGAGVLDYLNHTGHKGIVYGVNGAREPSDKNTYLNLRAESWGNMKLWLETADLPKDEDIKEDLTLVEYKFNKKNQIQLESKEDLKKRGERSPDLGDSLALTFALPSALSQFYEQDDYEDEEHGASAITGY